ncbi:MAG: hypothetical protein WD845_15860 [Pirellulales bacterium]
MRQILETLAVAAAGHLIVTLTKTPAFVNLARPFPAIDPDASSAVAALAALAATAKNIPEPFRQDRARPDEKLPA